MEKETALQTQPSQKFYGTSINDYWLIGRDYDCTWHDRMGLCANPTN